MPVVPLESKTPYSQELLLWRRKKPIINEAVKAYRSKDAVQKGFFFLNKAINFERLGLNWETLLQPYPAKVDVRGIKVAECLSCLNVTCVKIFTGKLFYHTARLPTFGSSSKSNVLLLYQ